MVYILAVDDEPMNRDIISEILCDDFDVVCVENGEECLKSIEEKKPDLLLLDVAMPDIDGIDVCKRLRADNKTKDMPILLLSGYAAEEHVRAGMEAGATQYITKPFVPSELLKRINDILKNTSSQ